MVDTIIFIVGVALLLTSVVLISADLINTYFNTEKAWWNKFFTLVATYEEVNGCAPTSLLLGYKDLDELITISGDRQDHLKILYNDSFESDPPMLNGLRIYLINRTKCFEVL